MSGIRIGLLLLVLAGCGPGPDVKCVTLDGASLETSVRWSCADVDRAVDIAAGAMADKVEGDPRLADPQRFRASLAGYTLAQAPTEIWLNPRGEEVLGYTDCTLRRITIGAVPWTDATVAHELAHAAQGCFLAHVGWLDTGVYDAQGEYQRRAERAARGAP